MLISKHWTRAIVLLSLGFYFLLPDIFGIHNVTISQIWPAALIIVGVLLVRGISKKEDKKKTPINLEKSMDGYIENTVLFGGDSKKVSSYNFKGGQISVICGGLEMDLTNCTLSKEANVITVNVMFGGLSLMVPREWNVRSEAIPVMAGIEDEINSYKDHYVDPAAELIIRGNVFMGGLEIKRN